MSKRPEVFDKEAVLQSLSRFTPSEKVAKETTSAMSLLIPLVIAELGLEQLTELVESGLRELGYPDGTIETWKSNRLPYIVNWAEHEIAEFRLRRQS